MVHKKNAESKTMVTDYAGRVQAAMKHANVGRQALADALGISYQAVKKVLDGKSGSFTAERNARAAEFCKVSSHWLATGEGEMLGKHYELIAEPGRYDSNVSEVVSRAKVPVISWIQAGELSEVFDLFHPGEAVQWEDAIHSKPSRHAYALVVEGDSMDRPGFAPTFPPGTVLIVDPDRASHASDYVIAKDVVTQKATFKQLTTDGARWYLKPLNPAYPTIEIDDPALRVIGRVVEYRPPGGKL